MIALARLYAAWALLWLGGASTRLARRCLGNPRGHLRESHRSTE